MLLARKRAARFAVRSGAENLRGPSGAALAARGRSPRAAPEGAAVVETGSVRVGIQDSAAAIVGQHTLCAVPLAIDGGGRVRDWQATGRERRNSAAIRH